MVVKIVPGCIVSLIVAYASFQIEEWSGIEISSATILFIVPAGAFTLGMAGASGAIAYGLYAEVLPTLGDYLFGMSLGILTMILLYWFRYHDLDADVSFFDFVKWWETGREIDVLIEFHHQHGHFKDVGPLGPLGYLMFLLQTLGFTAGGLAPSAWLESRLQ
jgi:hypothetical protein